MKPQAAGGKNRPPHNRERIDEMSGGKTEDRKRLEIDYRVEKARLIAARRSEQTLTLTLSPTLSVPLSSTP